MPKIAVNASDVLYTILEAPSCPVDLIKVPLGPYPDNKLVMAEARKRRPLLLHPLQAGVIDVTRWSEKDAVSDEALTELLVITDTPSLSTHVSLCIDSLPEEAPTWDGPTLVKRAMCRIAENCQRVRAILDTHRPGTPLLLENHPASPLGRALPFTTTPLFLNEVTRESGAEILLDVAHARITAWFTGTDIYGLLGQYDLNRVGELHISGVRVYPHWGMVDEHNTIQDEDYSILAWLLERTPARVISLEYGGMGDGLAMPDGSTLPCLRNLPAALLDQLLRLQDMVERVRSRA